MKKYPNLEARLCTTAAKYDVSATDLHNIIKQLCKKGMLRAAVKDFFRSFPYGSYVSDSILAYESKPRVMKLVMETIGLASYATENADVMRKIAAIARANKGRPLYAAMRTIGFVSRRTNDPSTVEKVVELAGEYKKNSLEVVMKTVEYAAKLSRVEGVVAAEAVSNVAEALGQDSVKVLARESYGAVLLEGVANLAYTGDKNLVREIAEAFCDDAVRKLSARYSGRDFTDRLNVLVETAVQTGNPEDIKRIASKW